MELVADPEEHVRSEGRSRRLAAHDDRAVLVLDHPADDGQAVVGRRRERMLRRKPVVDGDHAHPQRCGKRFVAQIVHARAARDQPAAVEVDVDAASLHTGGVEAPARNAGNDLVGATGSILQLSFQLRTGHGDATGEVEAYERAAVVLRRRAAVLGRFGAERLVLLGPSRHEVTVRRARGPC
jgi:hypothetical protein